MRSLGVEYDQRMEKEHLCGANRLDLADQARAVQSVKNKLKYHQANLKKIWVRQLQSVQVAKQSSPGPACYTTPDFTQSSALTKGKLSADSSHIGYRWGTAPKYRPDISLEERNLAQQRLQDRRLGQLSSARAHTQAAFRSRDSTPTRSLLRPSTMEGMNIDTMMYNRIPGCTFKIGPRTTPKMWDYTQVRAWPKCSYDRS